MTESKHHPLKEFAVGLGIAILFLISLVGVVLFAIILLIFSPVIYVLNTSNRRRYREFLGRYQAWLDGDGYGLGVLLRMT